MGKSIHAEAMELLLLSIYTQADDGLRSAFMFGKPGASHWDKRLGTEVFYLAGRLNRAALHVRKHGPAHLRYLPIGDIWNMLQSFVVDHYWLMADEALFKRFEGSYAEHLSLACKAVLADALASSAIFQPLNTLTLYPLVTVKVGDDFVSDGLCLVAPQSLVAKALPSGIDQRTFVGDSFPPLTRWEGRREQPSSWLCIRAPVHRAANKMKTAVLGALALTILPRYRYQCSMRKVFGGRCTISDTVTTAFGEAHTPALSHDIAITGADHDWLGVLVQKLSQPEKSVHREIKALEYFYRAWDLDPPERFPVLCMTLDAMFGEAGNASQAVIDGVRSVLGSHVCDKRLRQLIRLRASVIHGGAPDVYDSSKYGDYYDDHGADPIHDMELVVASCLRLKIFGGTLKEHADPNAAIIAEAQAKGRLPKRLPRNSILDTLP